MTLPNKRRGFRHIVVDSQSYRWRMFADGTIVIRLNSHPRQQLMVNIDWQDPWLQDRANMPYHHLHPCSSPITPKFVAMAIQASLKLGWQPELNNRFNINYRAGNFTLQT